MPQTLFHPLEMGFGRVLQAPDALSNCSRDGNILPHLGVLSLP